MLFYDSLFYLTECDKIKYNNRLLRVLGILASERRKIMKKILLTASAFVCAVTGLVAVACGGSIEEVSYKFDTQCEVSVDDVTVNKGEEFTLPTPPSRGKEWEFAGWYLSSDFAGAPVTSVVADVGTTYYAKWDRRYKINLDLKGGSLENSDDLYLKAGANVSAYLAEYVPAKNGYEFGQWLRGNSALGGNYRMPAEEITLTARYKVGYTLDVYTQNLARLLGDIDAAEYDMEAVTLYAYATNSFTVDYELQGFTQIRHKDQVLDGELVDEPEENDNKFAIFFNREQYTVTLNPNIAGTAQQEVSSTLYYGQEYKLPYDLYLNAGYIFAGWSESAYGENNYPIDYIDAMLYNKDPNDKSEVVWENPYVVESDATLYAYWNKGYSDLFGGADTIFVMGDGVYLQRGGMFFKGEWFSDTRFVFNDSDKLDWKGDFTGKILNEDMFCYDKDSLDGSVYYLYHPMYGFSMDESVNFKDHNNLTYTVKSEERTEVAYGTFEIDYETGEYKAYFDRGEGEMVGKTATFKLPGAVKTQSGNTYKIFTMRNEEEVALGTLKRIGLANATSLGTFSPAFDLTFDGYGYATWNYGSSPIQVMYGYNSEIDGYTLKQTNGSTFNIKFISEGGYSGYMLYFGDLDAQFDTGAGKLTLDGMIHARFEASASEIATGYYSLSESYFGTYILTFTGNGATYTFLMTQHRDIFAGTTTYEVEKRPNGYLEYYYYGGKNDKGEDTFYAPVLVLNEEEEGKANLYESVGGKLTKSATGTYVLDKKSGLYVFEFTDKVTEIDHTNSKFDITDLDAFVFALDASVADSRIYYIYSETGNSETADKAVVYTPDERYPNQAGSKLTIVGGIAILEIGEEESTIIGTIAEQEVEGVMVTLVKTTKGYVYLEIDHDKKTFFRYESTIGYTYLYKEDGTWEKTTTLYLNGKGGAIYTIPNPYATGEEDATISYTGTVEALKEEATLGGAIIYRFTQTGVSNPKTFRYILLSDSNRAYFSIISDKAGRFESDDSGTLELDGTGFNLIYTDTYGNTYKGQYRARTENIVYTYVGGEYLYFELNMTGESGGTFRLLGNEYGMYIVMDNQYADGTVLEFDGKGGVKLSEMIGDTESEEEGTSGTKPIADGTYTVSDDGVITINYELDGTPKKLEGRLGVVKIGNYRYSTFFVIYDSAAYTFVNEEDYSVLVFDDAGSAIRFTQTGKAEIGSYTLITDQSQGTNYNILYYVNNTGTYATIYEYNTETRLIKAVENKGMTYFKEDFTSLQFTKYGFAIFNGTERYYYYDEGENVVIYRMKTDGVTETANGYGYVKEKLGNFDKTIEWNNATYYKYEGFSLVFKRTDDNSGKYPIQFEDGGTTYKLTDIDFLPSGSTTFSVSGKATLSYEKDGKTVTEKRDCTVVRKALEGDAAGYETYVMVGDFRFDVALTYAPDQNKRDYSVEAMNLYIDAESLAFLSTVVEYYPQFGSAIIQMLPDCGRLTIKRPYDEKGNAGAYTASGEIGEVLKFLDADGNKIESFTDLPCEAAISENGESYTVTLTGKDGYTYKGVYSISRKYGVPAFTLAGFYREQTLTDGDYSVTVGRIIISEQQNYTPGMILVPGFTDNGTEVTSSAIFGSDDNLNYVVREKDDDGKFTSSVYYKISLKEKANSGGLGDDAVLPYDSVTITKIANVSVIYTEDGKGFVEIDESTNTVLAYCRTSMFGTSNYAVTEQTYDADNKTYVITTSSAKYTVKITENADGTKTATVETYVAPEET